jgi:TPR repeat protein
MSGDWRDVDRVALRASADAGESWAMHNLGVVAYYERDATTAIRWLLEAARRGHTESMYNLGLCSPHSVGETRPNHGTLRRPMRAIRERW